MELSDIYQESNEESGRRRADKGCCYYQLIRLRKYSLSICLAEALVIALVVFYLVFLGCDHREQPMVSTTSTPQVSNASTVLPGWIKGNEQFYRWMSGPRAGCNQRVHDFNYRVSCRSNSSCNAPGLATEQPVDSYDKIVVVTTSKAGDRLKRTETPAQWIECKRLDGCPKMGTKLVIYTGIQLQQIEGWGGALTDSSINNILALSVNGTQSLLDDYFSETGLRFNMIRITIGGSDFSSRFYTNDDTNLNETDFMLKNFKLQEEDLLHKIPMINYLNYNYGKALKVIASMWSPPTWMKDNGHFNKGRLIGSSKGPIFAGGGHDVYKRRRKRAADRRYFETLANLKMMFLQEYQKHGINFWALTVMNEPIFAVQPFLNFNTMIFPVEDYTMYVAKYLGPKLKNDYQLKKVKLLAHDDNRRYLMNYTNVVLQNKEALEYLDGIATHGYIDQDYVYMQRLYDTYTNQKGLTNFIVLPTELCSGHLPFMEKALVGNWHRGIHYGLDIIQSLQHAAAGWVDWNMVLDTEGGPGWLGGRLDSPVIVDKNQDLYHKSPMFYVLGQFSRYIPVGSRRLKSSISRNNYDYQLEVLAFLRPDQQITIVCLNNNPYNIELNVDKVIDGIDDSKRYLVLSCPADAIATFILKK